ncbi:MAG: outer membrane protein assembly factor BamA, partial [Candidatus Hydrogenedentes bacterium]|nr:outer membrane protein assembly factor BamA [Candidatus Hydrogenedentota bacterium]
MKKYAVAALALAIVVGASAVAQNLNELEVKEVKISGLERVSEQAVRSQLEVQPGQKYNPAAVARDIRRLYDLGHFETVQVDAQPVEGGMVLTYVVQEKRIIDQINIIGNNKMRASRIRGVLTWRQGDSFSPDLYDEERAAILNLYEQRGFANTTADINVEEIGASRVRITYAITEGRRARIRHIEFVGNQVLSHHRLRKALGIRPAFLFFGGKYNEEKLETGLDNIIDTYGNVGHLEAQIVSTDINYAPSGKRMELGITVAEGPQYKVGTLDIANNLVFDDDELVKIVEVLPGDVHNKGQVTEDASLIEKGYQDAGYVNAAVTPQVTLDREQHTTHVVHRVQEQDLKYINEIQITGNTVTRDEVVRRQLLIAPGDRYDGSAVKLSEQRLQATHYFDTVRITLHDLEDYDQYSDLVVDVEEGKTNNFNFGAGFSTDEGISGFAELKFTNFDIANWPRFSGGGQVFSARIQLGETSSRYSISFTDPEIFGQPLAFGFDIFDESYKYRRESDYTEDTRGGQIRFGKMLSPFVTARTSFRYVDVDYSQLGSQWLYTPIWRREMQPSTTIANT